MAQSAATIGKKKEGKKKEKMQYGVWEGDLD